MKAVLVCLSHTFIWAGFTIVTFLSQHDKLRFKIILFLVFLYFAYIVAQYMLNQRKKALVFTILTSGAFFLIKEIVFLFIS